MNNIQLNRERERLDEVWSRTREASGGDLFVQGHWGRYLCILAAGLVENGLRLIYGDFVSRAPAPIASYAVVHLERIQNPKTERIVQIARSFREDWAAELEAFVEDNGRKDAIDSIMSNRHQIAHGRNVGITVARVREYVDRAWEVLELVEDQCMR